jgi:hypothetical protein
VISSVRTDVHRRIDIELLFLLMTPFGGLVEETQLRVLMLPAPRRVAAHITLC